MVSQALFASSDLSDATVLPLGTVRYAHLDQRASDCKTCHTKWDGKTATADGIEHASRTGHAVWAVETCASMYLNEKRQTAAATTTQALARAHIDATQALAGRISDTVDLVALRALFTETQAQGALEDTIELADGPMTLRQILTDRADELKTTAGATT